MRIQQTSHFKLLLEITYLLSNQHSWQPNFHVNIACLIVLELFNRDQNLCSFYNPDKGVRMETWNNIAGNELWMMTSSDRYPNKPDTTVKIESLESPKSVNNLPDSYGLRMTTYYKVREEMDNTHRLEKILITSCAFIICIC